MWRLAVGGRRRYLKLIAFWAAFMVLHYAYEFLPLAPLKWLSAVDESFYQHSKITFFGYLMVNVAEYAWRGRRSANREAFVYARIFSTILIPWFTFITWFTGPAYLGRIASLAAEIVFANIALLVAGLCVLVVEERLEGLRYDTALKVVLLVLLLIAASQYVIFTFRMPWHDVFVDPTAGLMLGAG
jgi:hypothetical protein